MRLTDRADARASARCEAVTLPTTYSEAHRCHKRHGLRRIRGRLLCAHHRRSAA